MEEKNSEVPLFYESHYLVERQPCRECGSTNVYTRIYFHEVKFVARWLCRNCAEDYIEKEGYRLLTLDWKLEDKKE